MSTISTIRKGRHPVATLGVAAILAALVAVSPLAAAELPASVKALIPAAKKESSVLVYGRTLNPGQVRGFRKAISAFYGFPIKLKMVGGLHTHKAAEIKLAVKNGVPAGVDVFWTSYATSVAMEKAGVLIRFDWTKQFGLPAKLKSSEYGLRSHDVSLYFVVYNTDQVKAADAPRTYEDLLNPKWKGRIAMPRSPAPWIYLAYAVGEDKAAELLKGIVHGQKAKLLPRFSNVRQGVVSGEFAIGIGTDAFIPMRKGAPVNHAAVSPHSLSSWAFHMIKGTKSPNLAKLWGYWAASPDGQKALDRIAGLSFSDKQGSDLWKLTHDIKIAYLDYDYVAKNGRRLIRKYGKLLKVK